MKKIVSTVLCLFILLSCILPAMAATGVPEEVMESTKSVVRILSKYYNGAATGSGFVIKNEPGEVLIATNDHVVEGNPTSISIWVGEDRMVDAEIVFTTSEKDLCVLKVTDTVDMKPLKLSKEEPQHGAAIYVVGYPGAGDILSDTQAHTSESVTITDGIISAIRSFTIEKGGDPVKLLQVNAAINSGNSGGPLFNTEGVVVGVNTYKVNADSQGVFGSVAISELWSLLDQYGIEIPEEPGSVEKVIEESSFLMPVLICAGAIGFVLIIILIAKSRSRKAPQRKAKASKSQTATLQTYMEKYPQGLGIGGAVSLLLPAAIQLRNLHNDGKLHLQVCPENILIGADGASLKDPSSQETGRFNSGFAAPEIYKNAGFGITSDIYSFAAVLLYAATGNVPANSLQQEQLARGFEVLTDTAFAEVLQKSMAFGILERTQSMQELISGIAVYNIAVREKHLLQDTVAVFSAEAVVHAKIEKAKPTKVRKKTPPRKWKKAVLGFLLTVALMLGGAVCLLLCGLVPAPLLGATLAAEVTKGMPMDTAMALEWSAEGDVTVHSYTQQLLDNGYVRYTLDYTTRKDRIISIFDPPNGKQFMYMPYWRTKGGRQTLVFDIPAEDIAVVQEMTVKFFPVWEEEKKEIFVYTKPHHFDLSVLRQEDGNSSEPLTEEELHYQEAEKLLADGETAKAAIAFGKLGDYSDARNRSFVLWDEIAVRDTICAMGGLNELGTAGLMSDGTVLLTGGASSKLPHRKQHWESMSNDVDTWTNIIAIASGSSLFGLKADGSVNVAAPNGLWSEVEQWQDIVSISASDYFVLGLKMDGTVQVDSWKSSNDEENDRLAWIPELSKWTDIVAVSAGTYNAVGLRANGTVVVLGEPNREKYWREIEQWQNIITISTGPYGDTLGLKADGTLLSAGGYIANGDWDVSQWHNIVDFSVGYHQVLGVRSDGTVVADGYNHNGCISVKNWTDIIAVDTDGNSFGWHTVGLKSDGTVVAVGENTYGQCNVQSWTDIVLPGQLTAKPKDMPPADQQTQYDAAEKLLADGETAKAAIAFGKLGDYKDAHDRSFACWRSLNRYDTIDATSDCTVGIQSDGSVITAGEEFGHWYKTKEWSVVDLAAKGTNILGLQTDGTVVSEGWNDYGQMEVDTWTDIVDISASRTHSVGLKTNGKVVTAGMNRLGQCDVDNWNNIVSVSAGYSCTIGLKKDGTVIFTGDNSSGQCDFENWFDIVSVCANTYSNGRDLYVVGITSNGSVLATGNNDSGQCDISGWEDIISVSAGYKHTVGLKADGTVVAVGRNDFGQCNVDSWTDIVAVSAGGNNTVGLKSDGTVVAVGDNSRGQCNVSNWTDLKLPN